MNRNFQSDVAVAEALPQTIGRGTGCTIRELNRRLKEFMNLRKMSDLRWRTKEQVELERRRAGRIRCAATVARTDLWSQL